MNLNDRSVKIAGKTYIWNWSKWIFNSNGHSHSDFAHSFDFNCLTNFTKGINLFCRASLWCMLLPWLRKLPIYTSKSERWIPFRWTKFELECLLTKFIYFNAKFKVKNKQTNKQTNTRTLNNYVERRCIKTHFEKKNV